MSPLTRKAWRDVWTMKAQAIAIAIVVAAGVAVGIGSRGAYDSLILARSSFYESARFAHLFLRLERAPRRLVADVEQIPGVIAAEGRITTDVSVEIEGLKTPAVGRLQSVPSTGESRLNVPHVLRGRSLAPGTDSEVLMGEAFAEAHQMVPGDTITVLVNGRRRTLAVVGIVVSPEYVYQVKEGDFWPDDERYAVMWMRQEGLESALDMRGAFNDLVVRLDDPTSEPNVIAEVDRLTSMYGGLGAYGRDRQLSHRFLSDEMDGLKGSAIVVPILFVAVAIYLLRVVLGRLVMAQRAQIATLKAFGYPAGRVARHYLSIALLPVTLGAVFGVLSGVELAGLMTEMYTQYFRLPHLVSAPATSTLLTGVIAVISASALATWSTVRKAAAVPAAEGMQPEAPATFRASWWERWGVPDWLSSTWRAIFRQMSRRPLRAVASVLGLALAEAIMVVGMFGADSIQVLMDHEFRTAQRQDLTVVYSHPQSHAAHGDIAGRLGVVRAEPFRMEGVTIYARDGSRRTGITGIEHDAELRRLVDASGLPQKLPPSGLVLSKNLADDLHISTGDVVTIELLTGDRSRHEVTVHRVLDDLLGSGGYMDLGFMDRLLSPPRVSGAYVAVDPKHADALIEDLRATPGIAGVTDRAAALRSFDKLLDESLAIMRVVQSIFAVIIAVSIVYITARIALDERKRELASLRVLGFTRGQVTTMLLGELGLLTLTAVPIGLVVGWALAWAVANAYANELYRMPLDIHRGTYTFAVVVLLASTAAAALFVRRRVHRLDLLSALKTRE